MFIEVSICYFSLPADICARIQELFQEATVSASQHTQRGMSLHVWCHQELQYGVGLFPCRRWGQTHCCEMLFKAFKVFLT